MSSPSPPQKFSKRRELKNRVKDGTLNVVRTKVSQVCVLSGKDRLRHKDAETGTNLDLSYITNNVIAMSFPASGKEALWRNHIDDGIDLH
jgi:hypothetical protein